MTSAAGRRHVIGDWERVEMVKHGTFQIGAQDSSIFSSFSEKDERHTEFNQLRMQT